MAENQDRIDPDFEFFIRRRFSHISENQFQKMIIDIQTWILNSNRYRNSIKELLDFAARTMYRIFEFKEISIGVKDQNDGLFKYVTVLGFTKDAERFIRRTTYAPEEILDYDKYPGIKLSSTSDYCIADRMKNAYNRPIELNRKRDSTDEFMEGDYIDISIYDSKIQLIGWIELANPKNREIPSKDTMLWIELFASILGIMIERDFLYRSILKK